MEEMDDAQFLTIVKNVVEQHGCILVTWIWKTR